MNAPNVLLLDEPTNDLDIATLTRLEDYLDSFPGCLIVVSHDRYFLDRTVEHIFDVQPDGRVRAYPGGFSAFHEARERERAVSEPPSPARSPDGSSKASARVDESGPRKLSFKERRELEELEARISAAESRRAAVEDAIAKAGADYQQLQALTDELEGLDDALGRDVDRWGELAERA